MNLAWFADAESARNDDAQVFVEGNESPVEGTIVKGGEGDAVSGVNAPSLTRGVGSLRDRGRAAAACQG
jgi:hypothetical protein